QDNQNSANQIVSSIASFVASLSAVTGGKLALGTATTNLGNSDWTESGKIAVKYGSRDGIDLRVGTGSAHFANGDSAVDIKWLGASADEVNQTISDFDTQVRGKYVQDLQTTFNQVSGQGFLNTIKTAITTWDTQQHEEQTLGVTTDLVDKIFGASLKSALSGL